MLLVDIFITSTKILGKNKVAIFELRRVLKTFKDTIFFRGAAIHIEIRMPTPKFLGHKKGKWEFGVENKC